MTWRLTTLACFLMLLAACGRGGDDGPGSRPDGAQDPLLPVPQAGRSGVTGMPDAGTPGALPAPEAVEPAVPVDADGNPVLPDAVAQDDAGDPLDDGGPGSDAALAVVRDYYGAINAGNYGAAHALWADGGRASNQSPEGFAQGFADVRGVSVELGAPGAIQDTPGGPSVQVPVTLVATQADGSERRYAGRYTLRRGAADDAPLEQQQWRISAAQLDEIAP